MALQFASFGRARKELHELLDTDKHHYAPYLAGGLVGATVATVEGPFDLMKTRMQLKARDQSISTTSFYHTVSRTIRCGGFRSLFQGYHATVCRNVPGSAAYFGSYESLKRSLCSHCIFEGAMERYVPLVAGGMAGLSFWIISFPMDAVKTAMQADSLASWRLV